MTQLVPLTAMVTPAERERIRASAEKDRRTVSSWMRLVIVERLERESAR